ncbi:MAG: hypothetical protein R3Y10_01580 [Ferrimonas sp.]
MRQLILHIGCHKTGTTAIQRNLYQQRHALAQLGWRLFTPTNWLGWLNPNGHANKYVQVSGEGETLQAQLTARFFADLGRFGGNVIVSAEEISWLFDEAQICQCQQQLAALFDEITVVIYLRRQDKQLLSHYQQGFRFVDSYAARYFGRELAPLPRYQPYFDDYFDYANKCELWARYFGLHRLKVRWFERSLLHGQDASCDFFTVNQLPISGPFLSANESLSRERILANYFLLNAPFSSVRYQKYLAKKMARCPSHSNQKFLPTQAQAQAFYQRYHDANLRLLGRHFSEAERRAIVPTLNDFSVYPKEPAADFEQACAQAEAEFAQLKQQSAFLEQLFKLGEGARLW